MLNGKQAAVLLSLLFGVLVVTTALPAKPPEPQPAVAAAVKQPVRLHVYELSNIEPIDGDTCRAKLDLGFRLSMGPVRIRLEAVQSPEIDEAGYTAAAEFTAGWLKAKATKGVLVVETRKKDLDQYGRVLGDIIAPDGDRLSLVLLETKHAVPYRKGDRPPADGK